MEKNLLDALVKASKALSALIMILLLIYLFGELAYIYVPFIVAAAAVIYLIREASMSKARFRTVPDWDDYVRKRNIGRKARKAYYRESSDRYAAEGRQKHKAAKGRNKYA